MNPRPSVDRLREILRYEGGKLFWIARTSNRIRVGDEAGTKTPHGYLYVRVDGNVACAHRVIWAMVHGEWPDGWIDHINGDRLDNRVENLRIVDPTQSAANTGLRSDSTTGIKGVTWDRARGKFAAQIQFRKNHMLIGLFDCPNEAGSAYREKARELFGEFAREGFA